MVSESYFSPSYEILKGTYPALSTGGDTQLILFESIYVPLVVLAPNLQVIFLPD
jgi:hypothetical protein